MEHEVSRSMWISVSIITISSLLFLVLYTVTIGQELKSDALDYSYNITAAVKFGTLEELAVESQEIPAAAAYSLLQKHSEIIESVYYSDYGTTDEAGFPGEKLANRPEKLGGRVLVGATKTVSGLYRVTIAKR